ncbi:hypothetical protein EV140_2469 [Microcella alkaliphila]|uniref:Uncharacterized protein n=2 Tax=Microcella alkaliphila TaxID=279828 RepID=A0A0U5BFB2_9MICO|nr:hypothetical protein [Microcella alkaliphila]RZT58224.1 hypothetical protein EV140_2469 [Microcella alkaliphila]BAU32927.1 uncharacterized protein MalAC0309_2082 [Microcella alkaliphila]
MIDERMRARRLRVASSAVVAVVAITAAATAHGLAGGGIASAPALVAALLVGVPLGMLVIGRRLTAGRAAAGVLIDQAIFHGLFSFFGHAGSPTPSGGHAHHGVAGIAIDAPPAIAALSAAPMLASHAGAAVVAFATLMYGRAAIVRALASVAHSILIVFGATPIALAAPSTRPAHPAAAHRPAPSAVAVAVHPRRGPPTSLVTSTRTVSL